MPSSQSKTKQFIHHANGYFWIAVGAFLFTLSLQIFLIPNHLIDGGIVGIALILSRIYDSSYLPYFLIILNLPFVYLAYRSIRKSFVIHMLIAIGLLALFSKLFSHLPPFTGDSLEIIVFGGAILGVGAGLIIRYGACLDGTEILAILINQKKRF
ncbi:MAG: YitT family protein, partial [Chlamydiae bacterium]|nr:YitT family protein [Chlamydiota bacterium]